MPPAARLLDLDNCPVHGPMTLVSTGASTVLIEFMPAARVTDVSSCSPADPITKGSPTVIIQGLPAARIGDPTQHYGVINTGAPTVLIGDIGSGSTIPSRTGVPADPPRTTPGRPGQLAVAEAYSQALSWQSGMLASTIASQSLASAAESADALIEICPG